MGHFFGLRFLRGVVVHLADQDGPQMAGARDGVAHVCAME